MLKRWLPDGSPTGHPQNEGHRMPHPSITLAEGTIHNPAEPRHFMAVDPIKRRVRVLLGETVVAETTEALRLKEVGRTLYDPVIYIPREDLRAEITKSDHSTHCPLKGDCSWYDLADAKTIAWSYEAPFSFADVIAGRIAFDASRVVMEEHPV